MAEIFRWKVLRRHEGDRMYEEGETRQGTRAELEHLVPKVLELIGPAAVKAAKAAPAAPKAAVVSVRRNEPAPKNKAEGAAPANKATTGRKPKRQ